MIANVRNIFFRNDVLVPLVTKLIKTEMKFNWPQSSTTLKGKSFGPVHSEKKCYSPSFLTCDPDKTDI